jgi:hypothetical protein
LEVLVAEAHGPEHRAVGGAVIAIDHDGGKGTQRSVWILFQGKLGLEMEIR